jgi:hypothetical protein
MTAKTAYIHDIKLSVYVFYSSKDTCASHPSVSLAHNHVHLSLSSFMPFHHPPFYAHVPPTPPRPARQTAPQWPPTGTNTTPSRPRPVSGSLHECPTATLPTRIARRSPRPGSTPDWAGTSGATAAATPAIAPTPGVETAPPRVWTTLGRGRGPTPRISTSLPRVDRGTRRV